MGVHGLQLGVTKSPDLQPSECDQMAFSVSPLCNGARRNPEICGRIQGTRNRMIFVGKSFNLKLSGNAVHVMISFSNGEALVQSTSSPEGFRSKVFSYKMCPPSEDRWEVARAGDAAEGNNSTKREQLKRV